MEVMHSIYMLVMSGTPNPPWARLVCMASETLSFPYADPRRPRVRCIHREISPRTLSRNDHTGMPPWVGNSKRRIKVPSTTSHICANDGLREEHLSKKERTVPSNLRICTAHRPRGSSGGPVKENHTPRYRTASVGDTVVMVCSLSTPSASRATNVMGWTAPAAGEAA